MDGIRAGSATASVAGNALRVDFRCEQTELVAGGPLHVTTTVTGDEPATGLLAITGDSARQRPADFAFAGGVEGVELSDPAAGAAFVGGPASAVDLATGLPLQHRLLVNQYLDLERLMDALAPDRPAIMQLTCRRRLSVGTDSMSALTNPDPAWVEVELRIPVRRDDSELERLLAELVEAVQAGGAEGEPALTTLIALRTAGAVQALQRLRTDDPRVRAALRTLGR